MTASEAEASVTSFSVIAPTPRWMIRSETSSLDLDLEQRVLDGLDGAADVALEDEVELGVLTLLEAVEQRLERRAPTALREGGVALARSPLLGDLAGDAVLADDEEVVTGAGDAGEAEHLHRLAGLASCTFSPRSLSMARTRPKASPATIESPTRRVPRWTRTVATGPRPLSSRASIATPWRGDAVLEQLERGVRRQQDRVEELLHAGAGLRGDVDEHRRAAVLLGHQAVLGELAADLGRVGPSLSTLLTATTIGTSAACAWLSASIVCGLTPSSAATTSTAMSVTLAPRARMAVNASWPGVSMKVSSRTPPSTGWCTW
jgi:hypothetical protein